MAHPLYQQCLGMINQPVTVYHRNGQNYQGILQQVTQDGIYMTPVGGTSTASTSEKALKADTADKGNRDQLKTTEVFFAPFFFPFGALLGLTLGLAAGSAAYPYSYGYPYPYYW